MIALSIVMIHKDFDVSFKIARQEVVFEQDAVFQGLMSALYFTLGLWMIGRTTRMLLAFVLQLFSQIA